MGLVVLGPGGGAHGEGRVEDRGGGLLSGGAGFLSGMNGLMPRR
jgi:hypothetical protein